MVLAPELVVAAAVTVRHRWHLYAFELKPPPPGRTYHLWFITSDPRKISAGTFALADGKGSLVVPIPDNEAPIVAAADEPLGGATQPTGKVHLSGRLH